MLIKHLLRASVQFLLFLLISISLPSMFSTTAIVRSDEEPYTSLTIRGAYTSIGGISGNPLHPDQQSNDTSPPSSNVQPLPAYSRNDVTVRWSGSDDNSGIDYYDIQYRNGQQGLWQDWLLYTTATQSIFGKMPGETVYFRSRATDKDGHKESWPDGAGDAFTTFYNWAIRGTVMDNRLVPVSDVAVSTAQQIFENNPSDDQGVFSAYSDGFDAFYQIDFLRTGYGSLATSSFSALDDTTLDVLLPPADNIVADPGFESSATLAQSWGTGGTIVPVMTTARSHTGDQSVFLGSSFNLEKIAQFDADPNFTTKLGPKQDDAGRFHLVWYQGNTGNDKNIYYASGDSDGNWSEPETATASLTNISNLLWDVSPDGVVHIVWESNMGTYDNIYHLWKDENGWHGPTVVYNIGRASLYAFRVDSQGAGHLLWYLYDSTFDDGYYSYVSPNGAWSSPDPLSVPNDTEAYNLVLDKEDVVHLQWNYSGDDLLHNYRKPDGSWSERELVAPGGYNWYNDLLIDDNNDVHLVWGNASSGKIFHSKRHSDGTWSSPSYVSGGTEADPETLKAAAGPGGSLVLGWRGGSTSCRQPYAAFIDNDGAWVTTKRLSPGSDCINSFWFGRTDPQLFLYTDYQPGSDHNFCLLLLGEGSRSVAGECATLPASTYGSEKPHPTVAQDGFSHVFWRKSGTDDVMELIHSKTPANKTVADSRLWQEMALPPDLFNPTLSFAYWQGNVALQQSEGLSVSIDDGISSTTVFTGTITDGWQYHWIDLDQWSGSTVTVTFELVQTVGDSGTWSYIDEAHLGSAYPDIWLDVELQGRAYPGATLDLPMVFGNNSSVDAVGGEVTLILPPGLTFVESSLEPISQNGEIVWDVGTLSHSSGGGSIITKALVSKSLADNESLSVSAKIGCTTKELEVGNNTAHIDIVIERVKADFSASPIDGLLPLVVNFTNNSTGSYTQCLWDFGDDSTSDVCEDPSHTYENPGTYTVTLAVGGPGGEDTMTKMDYITVFESVKADFSASPQTGTPPLMVDFANLSSGDFLQCLWDFGDDSTSDVCEDPSHTYENSGTYTVTLTVDGPGGEDTVTKTDYITVFESVKADFSASPETGAPPLMVGFTNLSTGDFEQCLWDFGDNGAAATCDNPRHEYKSEGHHTVSLTVRGLGGEDTMTVQECVNVTYYRLYLPGVLRTK